MSVKEKENGTPVQTPQKQEPEKSFERTRRDLRLAALLLLLPILLLVIRTGWFKPADDGKVVLAPDYPLIKDEPNSQPTEDNQQKFEVSENGGAVALNYSDKVEYGLSDQTVTLFFANPGSSTQAVVLQIIVYGGVNVDTGKPEEYLLAESGILRPGYYVERLDADLESNVSLASGVYSGVMRVLFYNEDTGERAVVNTEIPVNISVS
mgnify:FL=1